MDQIAEKVMARIQTQFDTFCFATKQKAIIAKNDIMSGINNKSMMLGELTNWREYWRITQGEWKLRKHTQTHTH